MYYKKYLLFIAGEEKVSDIYFHKWDKQFNGFYKSFNRVKNKGENVFKWMLEVIFRLGNYKDTSKNVKLYTALTHTVGS